VGDRSAIEWTDATWNPVSGCSRVSAGCQHCYAERVAARFSGAGQPYEGLIHPSTRGWNGQVRVAGKDGLSQPLRWRRPRRIFVNSMSDLFHESISNADIAAIFGIMAACPQHTFQVLTKRPARMLEWFRWREKQIQDRDLTWEPWRVCEGEAVELVDELPAIGCQQPWPLPNVWLGVSVEDQETANERVPLLLQAPASVRWLSCEPLLGSVNLRRVDVPGYGFLDALTPGYFIDGRAPRYGISWVVAGGESGTSARPMHVDWARMLRDQCEDTGVPFLFKQWGEWAPATSGMWFHPLIDGPQYQARATGRDTHDFGAGYGAVRIGKRAAGRLLDAIEHDHYPESTHVR
jgi:protein gp37